MCEITSDNFDTKFQEISYILQKANFVAIDLEFSGLHLDTCQPAINDSLDQRYLKLKKCVQSFNVLQIGLCAFRYCNEQKTYFTDAFNFYLFPRNYGLNIDVNNVFQTSSVEFLCKYDFDFNKLLYKGISYMNNTQEKQLEAKLKKSLFFAGIERDIDEKVIQKICSEIADWLVTATIGECFQVSLAKSIQNYIMHQELRNRFDSIWTYDNENKIIIEKVSKEKRQELNKSDPNEIKRIIDMMLGFTKVFRLLIQYKKPVIFHCGFMDLMFMYEKFHEPLPDSIGEFKHKVNELFPIIYDTKHISFECRRLNKVIKDMYDSTVLENLYISLSREVGKRCSLYMPLVKPSVNSANYVNTRRPHEAGYDAYMCGSIFLKLAHTLVHFDTKSCYNLRANNTNDYFLIMKPFSNKVKLIKSSVDFVNFAGKDPKPINIKTLYVQSKSGTLSVYELIKAFSSFGPAEVVQKTKTSAYIIVDSELNAAYILAGFKNNEKYLVSQYSFWKHSPYLNHLIGLGVGLTALFTIYSLRK